MELLTPQEYAQGIAFGALLGGTINGGIAKLNGRSFLTGTLNGTPQPIAPIASLEPKILKPNEIKTPMQKPQSLPQTRGENLPKQYTQSKNLKINAGEIKQVDFKLSPRQQLHSGNIPGKSYLTKSPNQILNDINNRNFQFVKLNHRGMPIVKFNYPIGNVVQHGTGVNLGSTYYGTVHINKAGGIHIVPWLPK